MPMKVPHSKPPPKSPRYISPAEQAWLNRIKRQLAYDEHMQAKREIWLFQRPKPDGKCKGEDVPDE